MALPANREGVGRSTGCVEFEPTMKIIQTNISK